MTPLTHIVSFVLQHRPEAIGTLRAAVARLPGIELALSEGSRSVLLCEGEDDRILLAGAESLRDVPGVIGLSLVFHHAEPLRALVEEIGHDHAS